MCTNIFTIDIINYTKISNCLFIYDNYYSFLLMSQKGECTIQFFLQPWTKTQDVTDVQCGHLIKEPAQQEPEVKPEKEPLLGGVEMADPEAEEVKAAATFAVDEMNARSNSLYRNVLLDITHVTKQVKY